MWIVNASQRDDPEQSLRGQRRADRRRDRPRRALRRGRAPRRQQHVRRQHGTQGSALYVEGFPDSTADHEQPRHRCGGAGALISCAGLLRPNPPLMSYNDVVGVERDPVTAALPGPNRDEREHFGGTDVRRRRQRQLPSGQRFGRESMPRRQRRPVHGLSTAMPGPCDGDGDGSAISTWASTRRPARSSATIDIVPGTAPERDQAHRQGLDNGGRAAVDSIGFDARLAVDRGLCFGDAEAPAQRDCSRRSRRSFKDLDRDGDVDLSLVFDNTQTGIDSGDTPACLNGRGRSGLAVLGCDAIVTR